MPFPQKKEQATDHRDDGWHWQSASGPNWQLAQKGPKVSAQEHSISKMIVQGIEEVLKRIIGKRGGGGDSLTATLCGLPWHFYCVHCGSAPT